MSETETATATGAGPEFICRTDDREAWLAARRTGIGGSDMAAVMGLSKWTTPLAVYLDKIGEADPAPESEPMRWGKLLESVVRQEYCNQTGQVVRDAGLLRDPRHPWRIGTVDGITEGGHVAECKCTRNGAGWGEPGTDDIPEHIVIQVQHYMALTGLDVADVAVLIGGNDFRIYCVRLDPIAYGKITAAGAEFWQRVQDRNPPDPISVADAKALYGGGSEAGEVVANPAVTLAIQHLRDNAIEQKRLETMEDQAQTAIMTALGDRDTLVDLEGRPLVTWKMSKPSRKFDVKLFRESHPELVEQFTTTKPGSRRFLLKGETL